MTNEEYFERFNDIIARHKGCGGLLWERRRWELDGEGNSKLSAPIEAWCGKCKMEWNDLLNSPVPEQEIEVLSNSDMVRERILFELDEDEIFETEATEEWWRAIWEAHCQPYATLDQFMSVAQAEQDKWRKQQREMFWFLQDCYDASVEQTKKDEKAARFKRQRELARSLVEKAKESE